MSGPAGAWPETDRWALSWRPCRIPSTRHHRAFSWSTPTPTTSRPRGRVGRPLPRQGVHTDAGVLHRRRGGRHPQPGHGPARGPRATSPRSAATSWPRRPPIIGYDEVVMLGYRDSGMPGHRGQRRPRRLRQRAARRGGRPAGRGHPPERPQVIVTYGDDQQGYPHPDHIRVHDITVPAFERGRRPRRLPRGRASRGSRRSSTTRPGRGPAHRRHAREVPRARPRVALRRELVRAPDAGRADHDPRRRQPGLRRRATGPCWPTPPRSTRPRSSGSGCRPRCRPTVYPFDDYELARSLVADDVPEDDLFAGVADPVSR